MANGPTWLGQNENHFDDCHKRWTNLLNRRMFEPAYKEEWALQQCFSCIYYVPLTGVFRNDWGACTNGKSPFDRRVMFEHDGFLDIVGSTMPEQKCSGLNEIDQIGPDRVRCGRRRGAFWRHCSHVCCCEGFRMPAP